MANFNTHISVAAVASGLMATVTLKLGHIIDSEAVLLTALGTLGGILPDIDLKYSYPSRIIFSFLGIIASFIAVFSLQQQFSIMELWMTATAVFLVVRFPVWMVFHKFTTHRGAIHSLATALLFLFMVTTLGFHAFRQTELLAWLSGFAIFFGFIIHLLLDELYSVDFVGNKLKRSFGSAMKLIDFGQWISSSNICSLGLFFWLTTPAADELKVFAEQDTLDVLVDSFFPEGGWFGTSIENDN